MDLDGLVALLEGADREKLVDGLTGLTDAERKLLGPKVRGWIARGSGLRTEWLALAGLAVAAGARQAQTALTHAYLFRDDDVEAAVTVLARRAPTWLPDLAVHLLHQKETGALEWQLVRGLVRSGAVEAPDHPQYFGGTVRGVPDHRSKYGSPLVGRLRSDPGLIGDHLLTMLVTEGAGRHLAYHDGWQEKEVPYRDHVPGVDRTWRHALCELVADGDLDRAALLDTVLSAPLRDWAAADLGWYVGMHDALEPSLDEVADRQATYARLLTAEHGPSVKTAQRELQRLLTDPRLQPSLLLDGSRATLSRTDKATVVAQLRLLGRLTKARPDVAVADTLRVALDHPRADVREEAAKLLHAVGEPAPVAVPTVEVRGPEPESRPLASRVEPVSDADELADVLLSQLEDVDAVELERAVDGLLRLADQRPATGEVLLRRAEEVQVYLDDPRLAVVLLVRAWLTPRRRVRDGVWSVDLGHSYFPGRRAAPDTIVGALGRRITAVARAVREGPQAGIALPGRVDGSIEAADLSERLGALPRRKRPPELELGVALLRVPPGDRREVAVPRALRGSRVVRSALDTRPREWERAVLTYQQQRWSPERRAVVFRDGGAVAGSVLDGIHPRSRPEPSFVHEVTYGEYEARFEQTLAMAALLLPHEPDVLAAHAHPFLHRDLHKDRATSVTILDALARSQVPNGAPESSALVLGLAAKDARARAAAQDALLDLARFGLLDGRSLGGQAAALLGDDIVVGGRVSSGLAEAARASAAAAHPLLDALRELVVALPGRRDAGSFMELAADLAERLGGGLALPGPFEELAGSRSTSQLARALRRLTGSAGSAP